MTAKEIIEGVDNDRKSTLAQRAIDQRSPEGVGFMWALLNYRARAVPLHPPVPNAPVKVAEVARGFAPTGTAHEMGQWLYDTFADEINISAGVRAHLSNHHAMPADFDAAYAEISRLVNQNFP
jgi:hypothetical protein